MAKCILNSQIKLDFIAFIKTEAKTRNPQEIELFNLRKISDHPTSTLANVEHL